jgi:hypothetical protein
MEEDVKPYAHTRVGRGRIPARRVSPEEAAALLARAVAWRDNWRAEVAARGGEALGEARAEPCRAPAPAPARKDAAQFAAAVARREFGRFYWNGRLAEQLASAMEGGPARKRSRKTARALE